MRWFDELFLWKFFGKTSRHETEIFLSSKRRLELSRRRKRPLFCKRRRLAYKFIFSFAKTSGNQNWTRPCFTFQTLRWLKQGCTSLHINRDFSKVQTVSRLSQLAHSCSVCLMLTSASPANWILVGREFLLSTSAQVSTRQLTLRVPVQASVRCSSSNPAHFTPNWRKSQEITRILAELLKKPFDEVLGMFLASKNPDLFTLQS